jgi:hypothetical protein
VGKIFRGSKCNDTSYFATARLSSGGSVTKVVWYWHIGYNPR